MNTYWKMTHWFELIGRVLRDRAVLKENVYSMDEMLLMLGFVKVLVGKDDTRDYRGARVKRTMSGYTDSYISLQWLKRIFDPEMKERANNKLRVLIYDSFDTHETLEVLEYCFVNNIILCRLPSHTFHKLQPCDVAVFASLKAAYREQVEQLKRGGVKTIGKEHFTALFSPARKKAFTHEDVIASFAASGLFPFDPDRQNEVPRTPATPVSAEGLVSLQDLIIKQDAGTLDEASKQSLQRHLHKLAKTVQLSFAKGALQQNYIRFLLTINNEAKVKVMGYEELQEARQKRIEKDADEKAKEK
ncbi:DDE-domain-containing protein [Dothidotthia symphoricarpi CBS 119687]|uniref:DDE-domain-containing protein n=1 Tax=Dothidotthia symphoricarpi CBS 119687 TaxID=1392245 RepID=A0A6A5ZZC1_9PLEO|nr:DDE-domain-containing protein [Dothidotthia symphoricarpi CBS 119687]KAF2124636.1 DDE-domain-containing protein [Dothidotthia symphoricarpi CBS 119687]